MAINKAALAKICAEFEKENGEGFCYRLDEPETNILRNDRSVSAPYKRHLLGGYPKIEA